MIRCGAVLDKNSSGNKNNMGWLRDRFSRTYAYHYHKKAAQKAIKREDGGASTELMSAPTSGTTFTYERAAGKDEVHYRARFQLTLTRASPSSSSDPCSYNVTGQGTETCENRSQLFTIRDGRLAANTGKFYWTEYRPRREKHFVVGTMQTDHWDRFIWRVEDAYYVKRLDRERCGLPPDGDIRETILSFASVPTDSDNKKDDDAETNQEEKQQPPSQQETDDRTTEQKNNMPVDLDESVSMSGNDDVNATTATSTSAKTGALIGESGEAFTSHNHRHVENDAADVVEDETTEYSSIAETTRSTSADATTPPSALSQVDATPTTTSPIVNSDGDNDLEEPSEHQDLANELAENVTEDSVVTSLLPHIREARSLIDRILGKDDSEGDTTKALTIQTDNLRDVAADETLLADDDHGDALKPIALVIDKTVFQEHSEEDQDHDSTQEGQQNRFVFDESVFRESEEEEENVDIELLFSEESLNEEKEVLHTEVQRINKTFELLSNQHGGKYKIGRV